MKLVYIGKMEGFGPGDWRLWNILDVNSPYHMSSRTREGLEELGIIGNVILTKGGK